MRFCVLQEARELLAEPDSLSGRAVPLAQPAQPETPQIRLQLPYGLTVHYVNCPTSLLFSVPLLVTTRPESGDFCTSSTNRRVLQAPSHVQPPSRGEDDARHGQLPGQASSEEGVMSLCRRSGMNPDGWNIVSPALFLGAPDLAKHGRGTLPSLSPRSWIQPSRRRQELRSNLNHGSGCMGD
ncbi:hypothetical protein N657DRAFT_302385 [Parathielavia appendiculata]|uniref:Uncharacterized protein n=1 Tax=Parathielavia appendiculata TaxID=2587402 RepID=A0AAN6U4H9_9PEZI|nr:hypothetical protein N657DRAFT_302385 [Parathielavia appendiculata]